MDEGITANDTTIVQATSRIDEFNIRVRQLLVQNNQMDIESINVRRSRDNGGTAPLALLSYNDIVSMKPGSRRRHDMSKEWGKFETPLMIKLREQEPLQNFFGAMATLNKSGKQRDSQLYPLVVQAWDFLQKYVSASDRLD